MMPAGVSESARKLSFCAELNNNEEQGHCSVRWGAGKDIGGKSGACGGKDWDDWFSASEPFCAPFQQKRKLRIFISNTFNPAKSDAEDGEGTVASWELRVEGRLLEDVSDECDELVPSGRVSTYDSAREWP